MTERITELVIDERFWIRRANYHAGCYCAVGLLASQAGASNDELEIMPGLWELYANHGESIGRAVGLPVGAELYEWLKLVLAANDKVYGQRRKKKLIQLFALRGITLSFKEVA